MKTLTIHFSRNSKGAIFSRLLQWYVGSPISHVLVEFDTEKSLGQPFVYHSVIGTGVSLIPKKKFLLKNEIMESYTFELTVDEYRSIRNDLLNEGGEEYAMMQNLGIFIIDQIRRLTRIKYKNPFKKGKNCSELIYEKVIQKLYGDVSKYDKDLVKHSEIRSILKEKGIIPIFSKI